MSERTLVIERVFEASPSQVFEAWTDTVQLREWYGPEGMACVVYENDVRPGGSYSLAMKSSDGDYRLSGTYEEVDPPNRLVMTWKWATSDEITRVTVEFQPQGEGTKLRLTHTGFSGADQASSHEQGWQSTLNDLGRYLQRVG